MRIRTALASALVALPFALPAPAQAAQPLTWHLQQIRIGQSQAAGRNGAGITVAVVDTWVEHTHPDFGGRVVTGADCSGGTCKKGNVPRDGCDAHGTHVAGTIASKTYGVAPAAKIMPLRVLKWDGAECAGRSGDIAAAIRYAVSHDARIVNVSLGAAVPIQGQDANLDAAVTEAANAGVLVVFAAGNSNLPVTDSYGGDALLVAATDRAGNLADYSQHGTGVDLAAPGGEAVNEVCTESGCVLSTWDKGRFAYLSGTSMAAPHVSGIAALLMAQRARSRADVVARLRATAHPISGAGNGLVDAAAALGVSAKPPATPSAPPSSRPAVQVRSTPRAIPRPVVTPTPAPTRTVTPKPKPKPPSPIPTTPPPTTPPPATVAVVEPPLAATARHGRSRTVPATAAALLALGMAAGTAALATRPARRLP